MGALIRRSPLTWVGVCVVVAIVSWALLPTVPSYDPYSWIVWGREVSDPHIPFVVGNGPSWKPLPFAFTVVYGLFGSAAPALWVITARVGGLLGWVAAWRLGSRLAGGGRWGAVAGAIAVAGVLTTQDYGYYFMRGASEPGLVACTLWAIDRRLHGRRGAAFWLLVAGSLIRPEFWPFTGVYAGWLALRDPGWRRWRGRLRLAAGLLIVPIGWFGPPWLASSDPLLAAQNASLYDGHLGPDPMRAIIRRGVDDQIWPLLAAAILVVVVGVLWDRERRRVFAALGAGVVAGWVIVVVMTLGLGYPGLERFYLPEAAVVCVLGGVGIVWVAREVGRAVTRGRERVGVAAAAGAAALGVLVAGGVLASRTPIAALADAEPQAALAAQTLRGLDRAIAAAGGRRAVLPCAGSFAAVNHAAQPALAWRLGVTLERVGSAITRPGVDFIGPANIATGIPAAIAPPLTGDRRVARTGHWTVFALTDPRRPGTAACVGR